jgi:hypothetical protein
MQLLFDLTVSGGDRSELFTARRFTRRFLVALPSVYLLFHAGFLRALFIRGLLLPFIVFRDAVFIFCHRR